MVKRAKPTKNNQSTGNTGRAHRRNTRPTGYRPPAPPWLTGKTHYSQRYQPCNCENSPQTKRTQHLVGTQLSWVVCGNPATTQQGWEGQNSSCVLGPSGNMGCVACLIRRYCCGTTDRTHNLTVPNCDQHTIRLRSTPERSRARVTSDSSQRCGRRSQDRRQSRDLKNTQA